MSDIQMVTNNWDEAQVTVLRTGLVIASLILVPAVAARIGLGSSLTGALRIALMKASNRINAS